MFGILAPAVDKSKQLSVATQSREALSFMVVPQRLGDIKIRVTARGGPYTDTVSQDLTVKVNLWLNAGIRITV